MYPVMRVKKMCDILLCVFGAALVGAGVYFFKIPNNFSTGGVSGISVIIGRYIPSLSAGTIMSALNILLLLLGFVFCGRECGFKTVLGTLVLSGTLLLLGRLFPMPSPLTDEPLLELFFAVMLPAAGSAILFNRNATTGGTDIVAMILKKYLHMNIALALLISDMLITLGAFLFGAKTGLLSLLGLILKTLVVNSVIENINLCKRFEIITTDPDSVNGFIIGTLHRDSTVSDARGGYTGERKYCVQSVVNRGEAVKLSAFVKKEQPSAFVIITDTSAIIGKGFRGY